MPPCLPLRDWYEGGKSDHPDKRSVLLISRPPKTPFHAEPLHHQDNAKTDSVFSQYYPVLRAAAAKSK